MKRILTYIFACFFVLGARAEYVATGDSTSVYGNVTITFPKAVYSRLGYPFTVAEGRRILFAPGNLQYQASTGKWRFAEHQYDMFGESTANTDTVNSSRATTSEWIDMFSYGTSGWNGWVNKDSTLIYQPWKYGSETHRKKYINTNLTGIKQRADWAWYNEISLQEGGATINYEDSSWRVLEALEWKYLFFSRTNADKLFGMGRIKLSSSPDVYVNGMIILPDGTAYSSAIFNDGANTWSYSHTSYENNTFNSTSSWDAFESTYGAVFLPAAGGYEHYATQWSPSCSYLVKYCVNESGAYWSTTNNTKEKSYYMAFLGNGYGIYDTRIGGCNPGMDLFARHDDHLAVRPVCSYSEDGPSYTCNNCTDVELDRDGSSWNVTVNIKVNDSRSIAWSDGATTFERTITPTPGASIFTAYFMSKKPVYASDILLSDLYPDPQNRGTVVVTGIGAADRTLTATPNSGFVFLRWDDGVITPSRTLTAAEAAEKKFLTAYFAPAATSGEFIVDSYVNDWRSDSIIINTDAYDLQGLAEYTEVVVNSGTPVNGVHADLDKGIYKVPTGALTSHAGHTMQVVWFDKCDNVITHTRGITIPYIVHGTKNISELGVSASSDVYVTPGSTLTINNSTTINSLKIYEGGKVNVPAEKILTTGEVIMAADGTAGDKGRYPQMLVNGKVQKKGDATAAVPLYYDYTIDAQQYYPLMLPYNVNCATGITYRDGSKVKGRFEMKEYDGAARAATGNGWTVFDDTTEPSITANKGFDIYALPMKKKWSGVRQSKAVVRFTMAADLKDGEKVKVTPVSLNAGESPLGSGWNLVGNPYLSAFNNLDDDATAMAYLMYATCVDGAWDFSGESGEGFVRYISIPVDGFRNYEQVEVSEADIMPFTVFFVQAAKAGDLSFALADRHLASAPSRQRVPSVNIVTDERTTGITLIQGERSDHTGVLLGSNFTEAYDYNADLSKLFGTEDHLDIYSIGADNEPLAFCALPMTEDEFGQADNITIPLGYRNASTEQPAVIAFDESRYDASLFGALYLTDRYTGDVVNLLNEDYSFLPLAAADNERFTLGIAPRRTQEVTTGTEDITSLVQTADMVTVYDVLGRKVALINAGGFEVNADMLKMIHLPEGIYVIVQGDVVRKEFVK